MEVPPAGQILAADKEHGRGDVPVLAPPPPPPAAVLEEVLGAVEDEQPRVVVPPAGEILAAAAEDDVELGRGDGSVLPPPPPPPAAVVEEVLGAVEEEQPRVVVPPTAAWLTEDRLNKGLLILTAVILAFLFLYDMGVNPIAWWGKLAAMTGTQLFTVGFLTLGDIASLGLIFSQSASFLRLSTGGAAGLPMVVPPLAGIINCGVWLVYGLVVEDRNISVVVVNIIGVAFNFGYTIVFVLHSDTRRRYKFAAIVAAVIVAAAICAMYSFLFICTWGWEVPRAVGMSGAITGSSMYALGAMANMMAAYENRGSGGFSAQARASLANAVVWFSYASLQNDLNMQVHLELNVVAALFLSVLCGGILTGEFS